MKYTTREISEYTGLNMNTAVIKLKNLGYEPVERSAHFGALIWEIPSLEDVKKQINKLKLQSNNYISLKSLCNKFCIKKDNLYAIFKARNISPYFDIDTMPYYKKEQVHFLKELLAAPEIQTENHELVKDKRCLNINWFPDVNPKCFEDLDD